VIGSDSLNVPPAAPVTTPLDGCNHNDHLGGGAGTDVYRFSTGSGFDTIDDADGAGRIEMTGIGTLMGAGTVLCAWVWRSTDGRVTDSLVGGASGVGPGRLQDLQVRFANGCATGAVNGSVPSVRPSSPLRSQRAYRIATGRRFITQARSRQASSTAITAPYTTTSSYTALPERIHRKCRMASGPMR
jgi:hypothetical protein